MGSNCKSNVVLHSLTSQLAGGRPVGYSQINQNNPASSKVEEFGKGRSRYSTGEKRV